MYWKFNSKEVQIPPVTLGDLKDIQQKKSLNCPKHYLVVEPFSPEHSLPRNRQNQCGLPGQEWTFIVDESGIITSRFEGFGTFVELQDSLLTLLE